MSFSVYPNSFVDIQIQHLLKLNVKAFKIKDFMVLIQIQHLLKLNLGYTWWSKEAEKFKYNIC